MSANTATAKNKKRETFTTKRLVLMAMLAAILCVSAYISIPLPLPSSPHLTLQNFVIVLIALVLSPLEAFTTILVWMLLGIVGLPVFIGGQATFGYLMGPYSGYTVTFLLVGLVVPLIVGKGKAYSRVRGTIAAVAGVLLIDLLGMFWLMAYNHLSLSQGFVLGFLPFLPLDLIKAVVAAQVAPAFRRLDSSRSN